ncbi:MAG TPA: DUF1566 domain-containing protein [Thermoanaerobaculia bacterium]|nr:DUF1566 domain-containing protein [Thermoanaerobaculia bacterium]
MKNIAIQFFASLVAVAAGIAIPASALDFPASGQTTSYTANKNDGITAAVSVPDDGAVQAGSTLSFTDNGDGTITDDNTGLMWEKKGDNGGLHDKDNGYYWSGTGSVFQETIWDWLEDVNAEGGTGFAGYADWRIPNAKELQTLVDYESGAPMISAAFNNNCVSGITVLTGSCNPITGYWTSTTWARSTGMAWGVNFNEGLLFPYDKSSAPRVRAVRGRSNLPASGQTTAYKADKNDGIAGAVAVPDDGTVRAGSPLSYTDNGDGTITDNVTGLVWEKKGDNGNRHDKDNIYWWSGNGAEETVWDWLEDVNGEGLGGYGDWRIPNVRELLSIEDFQNQWAVPAAFLNNCVPGVSALTGSCTFQSIYWTSTTRKAAPSTAWYVDNYGALGTSFKSSTARARAVRGGTL